MLKACGKCGRIHDSKYKCTPPQKYKSDEKIERFRNSQAWKNKTKEIKTRDKYMCIACLNGLEGTIVKYNSQGLSVHHITSLASDFESRFDNDNLITLCRYHHEQAEKGNIKADLLRELIGGGEQE